MSTTPTFDPRAYNARPYTGGDPYADYRGTALDFGALVDLADRRLGGAVVAANDEFFADRENLLRPEPAVFDPHAFGHKGKVMDGWETRRRRGPDADRPHPSADDHDWALIRLALPGVVRGLVVDTAHFRGNHPTEVSVEAAHVEGTPTTDDLLKAEWTELVARTPVYGHAANGFEVADGHRWTHLRLRQFPDGGVARLRVHGEPVADPSWLAALGAFDLVALVNGGAVEDASDRFYSSPANIIAPGRSHKMDDGWENRRRRDTGHDWVRFRLAAQGEIRALELDTSYYKGNSAGWVTVLGRDAHGADPEAWFEIVGRTRLEPDGVHRFVFDAPVTATHVRTDVFPDGGIARLHVYGSPTPTGTAELEDRWAATRG
ncbi:allantoicase [Nocardiopsis lambiniae]|uniref:Probable allantoicase n=1 Tax=Nocardiopsis lambiniae TaxID=3075539 RepID=A0ABU2M433_9ACTN|nr:allantoicase [Nocardiopsis sp. DSM 44743]MDT0327408.1 allantoicase [Nocardiopsis sp. DSM 44743]